MSNEIEQVYFTNHVHRILRPSDDAIGEASAHGLSLASNVQIGTVDAALKIFKLDSTGNFTTSNNFILKGINGPTVNTVRIQGQLVVESGNGLFLNGLSGIIVTSSSSDNVYLKLQRTVNTKDSLVHFIPQGTLSSSNPEFRLGIPGNSTGFSLARYDGSTSLNFVNVSALGLVTILSGTTISGNLAVSGTSTLRGNTDVLGTLSVTGTSTLRGNTTVLGTLGVSGLTSLNTLTTTGVVNANSLNVGGNTSLTGTLVVGSTATVTGTLSVTGATTLRGNTTVLGTLGVSGLTSLNTLTTTGVVNASSLNVGGNTSLTGTLVVGSTATVTGTLSVTGATTLRGAVNTLNTLQVGTDTTVTGILSVTGATTLRGSVNTLSTLQVGTDVTVTGNLNVTGATTVRSTLSVSGNSTLTGNLGVSGTVNFGAGTTNLAKYSEDFSNALWIKTTLTTLTYNNSSPDGSATAMQATANAADSFARQTISGLVNGSTYTFSVWLRTTAGTNTINIYLSDGGSPVLTACSVTTTWTRFTVTRTIAATSVDIQVGGGSTWSSPEILQVWGAQLEESSYAKIYVPTVASSATSSDSVTLTSFGHVGINTASPLAGFDVNDDAVFRSGVTVSGLTSLNTLTTTGVVNASSLNVGGNTTLTGTLNVTGATTLRGAANTLSTLQVGTDTTITGTLNVTGTSTLRGAANTLSTLQVGTDTTITGNLNVTGATTFSGLVTFKSGATVSGNLNVTGTSTLRGVVNTLSDFQVAGNTTLTGTLGVTGSSNFSGIATFQSGVTISGLTSINTLTTTGVINANSLNVSGNATVTGALGVSGLTSLNTLKTTGAINASSLNVAGDASITGALGVSGLTSLGTSPYQYSQLTVATKLSITHANNALLVFYGGGSNLGINALSNTLKFFNPSGPITFEMGSATERMRIQTDGKVGINTDAPASGLDVNADAVFRSGVTVSGNLSTKLGNVSISNTNNALLVLNGGNSNLGIDASSSDVLKFFNPSGPITFEMGSATERMRIQTDGKVGINTDAPASGLDVNADAVFRSGVTVSGLSYFKDSLEIRKDQSSTTKLALINASSAGLAPGVSLVLSGSSGFTTLSHSSNSNTLTLANLYGNMAFNAVAPNIITFSTDGGNNAHIAISGGRLGINTSSPNSGLDVNADAVFRSGVTISGNINSSIPIEIGETNRNLLLHSQDFSKPSWSRLNISDGGTPVNSPDFHPSSASQITGNGGNGLINQQVATTIGQTYVGSIFLKGTGAGSVSLNLTNDNGVGGTISATTCNYTTSWQRFSVTGTANTTGTRLYVGSTLDGSWGNGEAIALWGAQLESGTVATRYISTATGNPISSGIIATDSNLKKTYFDGTAEIRNDGESLRLVGQANTYMTFYATGTSASGRTGYLGFTNANNLNEFRIETPNAAAVLTGTSGWTFSSDASLKKDIESISYGLDTLKNMSPKSFRMATDSQDSGKLLGFIAQEVKDILPEAVGEIHSNGTKHLGITYNTFIPVIVKSIQDLSDKLDSLEEKLTSKGIL